MVLACPRAIAKHPVSPGPRVQFSIVCELKRRRLRPFSSTVIPRSRLPVVEKTSVETVTNEAAVPPELITSPASINWPADAPLRIVDACALMIASRAGPDGVTLTTTVVSFDAALSPHAFRALTRTK
jgi:hypothetical protein